MSEITGVRRFVPLLSLFALGLWAPRAHASETAAVVSIRLSPNLEHDRAALEHALVSALQNGGFQMIPPADVAMRLVGHDDLRTCSAELCLPDVARLVGTSFLVFGDVASTRRQYEIDLRVVDATDGRYLASETLDCSATDPCPPIAGGLADSARRLAERALREIALAGRGASTGPPRVLSPAAATPPLAPSPRPPTVPERREAPANLGAAFLIGSGVALVVTSIALFALDGRGTDCQRDGVCLRRRETTIPAVMTGILGLGATTAGFAYGKRF